MRKAVLLSLTLATSLALPALAVEKHQSYVSYDDGGTIVRQAEDGREIDARVNLPIFPGDEVVTSRRGRAEIRLSDGNVLGVDRASAVRLQSILDSYEGEDSQTVVQLRYGKVGIHRTEIGRELVRLDTDHASYVAHREAVYFVEAGARGSDRVIVFDGAIEVRTPTRSTRLRAGEGASLDDRGIYDLVSDVEYGSDDFERWFARRSDRRGASSSRYLDRRLGYYGADLDTYGTWVSIGGIGWGWRPYVSVGWRPYYNGYWHRSRHGFLTWVSYEPWGWAPYHYGRWTWDSIYGWVWVPGGGYAPAWVYWWYEPGFFGWAPAGWWDCYRPYYGWAYEPYNRASLTFGVGFYGRVRVNELDLRPWTFIDANNIVSTRVDRAALTMDAVKARLGRSTGGFATVSSDPARFTNEQFRDPAAAIKAIARRGVGNPSTAPGAAAPITDVTSFFRRDANPGAAVRDRIVASRGGGQVASGPTVIRGGGGASIPIDGGVAPVGRSGVAPIGRGGVAPVGGGSVAPIGGGSVAPIGGTTTQPAAREGGINRGIPDRWRNPAVPEDPADSSVSRPQPVDRTGGIRRRDDPAEGSGTRGAIATPSDSGRGDAIQRDRGSQPGARVIPDESWRRRPSSTPDTSSATPDRGSSGRSSREPSSIDIPRRVIDRIGGARVVPRDGGDGASSSRRSGRSYDSPRAARPSGGDRSSSSPSSGHSSPGHSSSGASAPSRPSGGESRSAPPSGGENRGSGGQIHRDQ